MSAIAASLRTVAGIGLPPLRPIDLRFHPEAGLVEVRYDPGDKQEAIRMPATKFWRFSRVLLRPGSHSVAPPC